MALRSYCDGSVTTARSMTLASVSADGSVWAEIEPAWDEILKRHGAAYMHMKEAMPRTKEFHGWTEAKRDALLVDLLGLLQGYRDNPRIQMFSCSVDLAAHTRWARIQNHPHPARLCARIVFPHIVEWYWALKDSILDVMEIYFDRDEPYLTHIQEDWRSKKVRRRYPAWAIIRTIAPADMRLTIPLQIADMFAWSRNRLETSEHDDFYDRALTITHSLRGLHREVGEKAMAESTFPEEGLLRRERAFEAARRRH